MKDAELQEMQDYVRRTHWIMLQDGSIYPASSLEQWIEWWEVADRKVRRTSLFGITVSTVFLGVNHDWFSEDGINPVIFETMVFGGVLDQEMDRCRDYNAAVKMHWNMVFLVLKAELLNQLIPFTIGVAAVLFAYILWRFGWG